mmetsp:Transcript_2611/g.6094  ORF Transcript_2611/g.6094 Transcript_2611/m.6094 type:complete len:200 (+) Transcript_2611:430-1029(+)
MKVTITNVSKERGRDVGLSNIGHSLFHKVRELRQRHANISWGASAARAELLHSPVRLMASLPKLAAVLLSIGKVKVANKTVHFGNILHNHNLLLNRCLRTMKLQKQTRGISRHVKILDGVAASSNSLKGVSAKELGTGKRDSILKSSHNRVDSTTHIRKGTYSCGLRLRLAVELQRNLSYTCQCALTANNEAGEVVASA